MINVLLFHADYADFINPRNPRETT